MGSSDSRISRMSHAAIIFISPTIIIGFCILTSLQSLQSKPNAVVFTIGYIIAGLAWVAAGWLQARRLSTYSVLWTVLFAVVFRVILLPFGPLFDNDIYRYLWDGHIAANGINPFLYPPAAEQLMPLRTCYYPRIGFPEISTIYPPFAQFIFLTAAKLHLTSAPLFKLILLPFDIGIMVIIVGLLKRIGKPAEFLIFYAWSPLILKEFYNSAHIDIIMMCLMLLALYLVSLDRNAFGGVAMALSVMTKGVSIVVLPLLVRRRGWLLLSFISVALVLWLPYSSAGVKALGGASAYMHYWRFNDGLFYLFYLLEQTFRSQELVTAPYAKVIAALVLFSYMTYLLQQKDDSIKGLIIRCASITFALLLLMPVVNPWYVCWLIPFLCLTQNRAMIALCLLCPMSYIYYGHYSFPEWIRLAEYLPVFFLIAISLVKKYRLQGAEHIEQPILDRLVMSILAATQQVLVNKIEPKK